MSAQPEASGPVSPAVAADHHPSSTSPSAAPGTVRAAVAIMVLRAVLALLVVVILFAAKDTLRRAVLKKNPGWDPSRVDQGVNTVVGIGVFFAVVYLVLYLLLAWQVSQGKNWARIVTWVLAGLAVVSQLGSLALAAAPASRIAGLVELVLDVALIVLLATSSSNRYFRNSA